MKKIFLIDCENMPKAFFHKNGKKFFEMEDEDYEIYAFHNPSMIPGIAYTEELKDKIHYVKVETFDLKDALDFVLCTYLGTLTERYKEDAVYYIISDDRNYNIPLMHLAGRNNYIIRCINKEEMKEIDKGNYTNYQDMLEKEHIYSQIKARAEKTEEKVNTRNFYIDLSDEDISAMKFIQENSKSMENVWGKALDETPDSSKKWWGGYFSDEEPQDNNEPKLSDIESIWKDFDLLNEKKELERKQAEGDKEFCEERIIEYCSPFTKEDFEDAEEDVKETDNKEKKDSLKWLLENKLVDKKDKKKFLKSKTFIDNKPNDIDMSLWKSCFNEYVTHKYYTEKPKKTIEQKLERHIPKNKIKKVITAISKAIDEYDTTDSSKKNT